MTAFHAYDIRGIYGTDFDKDDAYKIGFFLPAILGAKKVLLGRDARVSSPEIYSYLSEGLTDAGVHVHQAGLATTPMIYWATARFGFDASVMITASHNPPEYNGMKVSRKGALPVGYDNGLNVVESMMKRGDPVHPFRKKGNIDDFSFRDSYLDFMRSKIRSIDTLNIAVDCSNGMAGLLARDLLGDSPTYLNEQPDGRFPGHDPNPLKPENREQLREAVMTNGCDLGVIFDGDADRVMFLDEQGSFVPPDLIIAVLGHHFLKNGKGTEDVLQDIRTSKSVQEYLARFGARVHTWKVGRAFAVPRLRELKGIYGGEFAGHYYFRDFYYSDSGILAALLVMDIAAELKKEGQSFSSLVNEIRRYENSGEINFRVENKAAAMEAVKVHYLSAERPRNFYDFDGYRVEYNDWWFNIRPSNTEPYLRLVVEAHTPRKLSEKVQEISKMVKEFN
jgi:phosphomannomutase